MSATLGRRLPEGSRFITVEDLYAMDVDEVSRTLVWTGAPPGERYSGWMAADRLLHAIPTHRSSSLSNAPSGLVVVIRQVPE